MLTDEDLEKLKKVMATKEDLKSLATKKDLVGLLTLKEFDEYKKEIKEDVKNLQESINTLTISIDGLVKSINKLTTEYAAVTLKLTRHEKWIQMIADKVGVKLEV